MIIVWAGSRPSAADGCFCALTWVAFLSFLCWYCVTLAITQQATLLLGLSVTSPLNLCMTQWISHTRTEHSTLIVVKSLRQCCDIHLTKKLLSVWGDLSDLMSRFWWLIHPNTYTCALWFMCTAVWALHLCLRVQTAMNCPCCKCRLWSRSWRQVQLVLFLWYHRSLPGCLSLPSCILCNLCRSAHLSSVRLRLCMLHRLEQLPFFTFMGCELMVRGTQLFIDCAYLGAGEAFAKLCLLVWQCYIRGCWMWTHCIMDLSVSQEKWIRHWSKACPAC